MASLLRAGVRGQDTEAATGWIGRAPARQAILDGSYAFPEPEKIA
jgi:hypothetical protein